MLLLCMSQKIILRFTKSIPDFKFQWSERRKQFKVVSYQIMGEVGNKRMQPYSRSEDLIGHMFINLQFAKIPVNLGFFSIYFFFILSSKFLVPNIDTFQ